MKLSKNNLELLAFAALFLSALYLWTLPMQSVKLPFGDVDASSHFVIGDLMVQTDKAVLEQPYHVKFRYYGQNNNYPSYLWYPPQYWTLTAMLQVFGGERILPVFFGIALLSLAFVLTSFILIKELFGFWTAWLASLLLMFSTRDYMIYLWGQWPQSLSFGLTPLILYCYYRHIMSLKDSKTSQTPFNRAYIYFISIFLAGQFFFHPQGLVASAGAMIITTALFAIKHKKLFFNLKHTAAAILIFFAVTSAFAPFNVGEFWHELLSGDESPTSHSNLGKLLKWYHIQKDEGLPDFYFTYSKTHGSFNGGILSWWTLPFLFLGILLIIYWRRDEHLVMLSWLIALYFLTRMGAFGMGTRDIRMFAFEAHVFYPIIAFGAISLSGFFGRHKQYAKYGIIALFLILAVSINGKSAYNVLNGMQYSISRINPYQYEAAEWIMGNLGAEDNIYDIGTLGYSYYSGKIKWMSALSQRHFIMEDRWKNITNYVLFDYTDPMLMKDQNQINAMQEMEKNFANFTLVYNRNQIKVYKVGTPN